MENAVKVIKCKSLRLYPLFLSFLFFSILSFRLASFSQPLKVAGLSSDLCFSICSFRCLFYQFCDCILMSCSWIYTLQPRWHGRREAAVDGGGGGRAAACRGGAHEDPLHLPLPHRCILLGGQGTHADATGIIVFLLPVSNLHPV